MELAYNKWNRIFLVASASLFAIALTQPAYYIDRSDYDAWSGSFMLLLVGWMGVPFGFGAALSWCANPLLILSWLHINRQPARALLFALSATLFSVSFLYFSSVIVDENGGVATIAKRCSGYWLWLIEKITVDIMPTEDPSIGFSNKCYPEGHKNAITYVIDDRCTVRILDSPYFLATKFEAFNGRGNNDGRTSHDFEDINLRFGKPIGNMARNGHCSQ